ncbi:hypothetical protein EZS27_035414, partial [termite gut metagenome]
TIHSWVFDTGLDLAVASGFTSAFVVQQAYADIRYKWLGLRLGSWEEMPTPLNHSLSSGGMSWSGNARPIPQIRAGFPDYITLFPFFKLKCETSYGWFTDNNFQKKTVGETDYKYVKNAKYHHKSLYIRIGKPQWRLSFEGGYTLDEQFGGYQMIGKEQVWDLGNTMKDYVVAFIPQSGGDDGPANETYFKGNYTGNEHFKFSYQLKNSTISAYMENYYEDFSGMGKLNGMDGLWGIEYATNQKQIINAVVLEYLQTTNQSSPLVIMVPSDVSKKDIVTDNYYNNWIYVSWQHWGMALGNPLLRSPIYNQNGYLGFPYNRVKAVHVGWSGDITDKWTYRMKLTYNQTFGTVTEPTLDILDNYSTFAEVTYMPQMTNGWIFTASTAFDTGYLYGDNWGIQLKINKKF